MQINNPTHMENDFQINTDGSIVSQSGIVDGYLSQPQIDFQTSCEVDDKYIWSFVLPLVKMEDIVVSKIKDSEEEHATVNISIDEDSLVDNKYIHYFDQIIRIDTSRYDYNTITVSFNNNILKICVDIFPQFTKKVVQIENGHIE